MNGQYRQSAARGMWCWLNRRHLTALVDGELGNRRAARVLRHIEHCAECRVLYDEIRESVASHGDLLRSVMSDASEPDVDRLVAGLRRRVKELDEGANRWMWRPVFAGVVIAAAVTILLLAQKMLREPTWPGPRSSTQVAEMLEENAKGSVTGEAPSRKAWQEVPGNGSRGQQLAGQGLPATDRPEAEPRADIPTEVARTPEMFLEYEILVRLEALEHFEAVLGVPDEG